MDLGLRDLTDDQLLELVLETCLELGNRDPYLRNLAQSTITTEAQRLALRRASLKEAVTRQMGLYIKSIRKEAEEAVSAAVNKGTLSLLTPDQEVKLVLDGTLEAKLTLIRAAIARIEQEPEGDEAVNEEDFEAWSAMRDRQQARAQP